MELKLMPDLPGYAITRDGRIFSLPRVIMRKDGKPETFFNQVLTVAVPCKVP